MCTGSVRVIATPFQDGRRFLEPSCKQLGGAGGRGGGRRLVLFDMDGTLVDSTPGIWASIRVAATELGLPDPTPEQLRSMVGPPLQDGFAVAFGLRGDDVDRAVAAYRGHYAAGAMYDADVHPASRSCWRAARRRCRPGGRHQQAASRSRSRILEHTGLARWFASVHGATLDGAVRHKEQVVAAALAAHPDGVRPVLVGDRSHDVLGARAHGLPCIGAGWGPAPPGELAAAGAVAVVDTPAGVLAVLAGL